MTRWGCGRCAAQLVRPECAAGRDRAARTGCWSSGCWTRGCEYSRCIPTRSPRPGRASASRAASPIALTRSCCASWRAPTVIASGCLSPTATRPRRCRALCRGREDLVQTRVALTNQLRAELERFWPGAVNRSVQLELDSPIALAFLEQVSEPARRAERSARSGLAAFLARQHYSGRKTPGGAVAQASKRARGPRRRSPRSTARRRLVLTLVGAAHAAGRRDQSNSSATSPRRSPSTPTATCSERCSATRNRSSPPPRAGRGDRRLPRPLPHQRRARRRRRSSRRGDRVRQAQGRLLPLGVQQTPPRRGLHTRRLHPPLAPVGGRPTTPARSPAATTTPARSAASAAPGAASCGAAYRSSWVLPRPPPGTGPTLLAPLVVEGHCQTSPFPAG